MFVANSMVILQITLPTGATLVGTVYGRNLFTVSMYPSTFDVDSTRGLGGILNGNTADDKTPRTPGVEFVRSWL